MENLNREAILRMLSGKTGNSSSGGGGGDIDLAGYATMIWVTENFVSIDFFRELFRAYDSNSQEILPNDTTSVVASIKAMVGTWTEQYLTALGNQSDGGGGGGGAQYLNDLLDVQLTTPLTDGQALVYNATLQKWVNGAAGVNMTTVWNALSGSTNEQINASHLSTALSGYVTTSAISDMATQTWVGQQGFATQTWVTSNFITIAYFDRLFRAYNGSTLVSHNDTTTTIDNIKAMLGFWTDFYLSALGTGGVSSVSISLSQLNDVNVAGVTNNQFLGYDSTNSEWVNTSLKTINGNSIIGTGDLTIAGVSSLSALTDVVINSATNWQALIYNISTTKWENTSLKTINGQSIVGSGDISVGGGASGNYLPLTGGTLTGALNIDSSADLYFFTGSTPRTYFGWDTPSSMTWIYDFTSAQSIRLYAAGYMSLWSSHVFVGDRLLSNSYNLEIAGTTASDKFIVKSGTDNAFISYFNGLYQFDTGENLRCYVGMDGSTSKFHIFLAPSIYFTLNDSNDGHASIMASGSTVLSLKSSSSYVFMDFIKNGVGMGWIGISEFNTLTMAKVGFDLNIEPTNGYVGIGTYTPYYRLHVAGDVYATGGVTALSDIRHKTVIRDAAVSVEDIARMPAVMYQWNDGREDNELHVGSIAQNWQTVLPEVVLKANDEEGTLSMQYGVAALVSSIIIARKVVNHEERIRQLEKENKELKKRLNIA